MGEEMFFYPSVTPHIINIWSVSSGGQSSSSELVWGRCFLFFRPKCRDQYSVSVSLTAKHLLCGEGNAWEDWNQEPFGSWNLLDKHWFCSWQMFLAKGFKKVGCEAGLSLNGWMVQGGAMHWQKMGWRRRGSASPQRAWELMTNKGLNMSWWYSWCCDWSVEPEKNWEIRVLLFVPYPLSLPSLAGLCWSCPPVTSSEQLQALAAFPALLHCSWRQPGLLLATLSQEAGWKHFHQSRIGYHIL